MDSKYQDKYDNNNVICPYCGFSYEPECGDYSDYERPEQCEKCRMNFYVQQIFEVSHQTKPDCSLNNKNHNWVEVNLRNGSKHDFCSICDKCRSFRDG